MARKARSTLNLIPGQRYHVTGHGHDDDLIFDNALDRIVFLLFLAEACIKCGVKCFAWCLMSNHYHLVIEDSRGVLSQFMHRLGGRYAQYFNSTRPRRRRGALLRDRFHARVINSDVYLRNVCAYVHLNPLRCREPLARSADLYLWSSARFTLAPSNATAAADCLWLLEQVGGTALLLNEKRSRTRNRGVRHLLALFLTGDWMDRTPALAGLTAKQYARVLMAAKRLPEPTERLDLEESEWLEIWHALEADRVVKPTSAPYEGVRLSSCITQVQEVCERMSPRSSAADEDVGRDLLIYTLWRFSSAAAEQIASELRLAIDVVTVALERMRNLLAEDPGWVQIFNRSEWALRWKLLGGPHRA